MRKKILNWLGIFAMVAFLVTVVNVSDVNADTLEGDAVPAVAGEVLEGDELSGDGILPEDLEAPDEELIVDGSEGEEVLGEGEEIIEDEGEGGEPEIETGWVEKDGYWYYHDEEGKPVIGWQDIDGSRYYFEADGKMATEWKKIDSYWYYFEEYDGWMYTYGTWFIGETIYAFDENGRMIAGRWFEENYGDGYSNWYYLASNGKALTGWQKIGKSWYYFDEDFAYMYADGICTVGGEEVWVPEPVYDEELGEYVDGYYDEDGDWVEYGYYDIVGGTKYAFAASGAMITGWFEEKYEEWYDEEEGMWYPGGSDWYYFKSGGAMHYGWLLLGKTYYYFDKEDGWMYSDGIWNIGGVWDDETGKYVGGADYAFKPGGAMVTGWYKEEWYDEEYDETWIDWYYFKSSGAMQYGWLKLGKVYYYFDKEYGYMYADDIYLIGGKEVWVDTSYEDEETGEWVEDGYLDTVGGTWYGFKPSGAMATGWYKYFYDEEYYDWYYFKSSGAMHYGWLKSGTKWYYFDEDEGWMYANGPWYVGQVYDEEFDMWIGGVLYGFDKSGAMASGWIKFENGDGSYEWYYFNKDGTAYDGWLKSGTKWYYINEGWMVYDMVWYDGQTYDDETDDIVDVGTPYYLDANGYMFTGGWKIIMIDEGGWKEIWVEDGYYDYEWEENWVERTLYFQNNGKGYINGTFVIDGKEYKFDENGYCTTPVEL